MYPALGNVTIVGMGRTALALAKLVLLKGGAPFVTEAAGRETVAPFCRELDRMGVPFECGGHSAQAFKGVKFVVPSPGVPPDIEPIRSAHGAGAEVLGELELAWRYCPAKILAVTGTNGKTTTTELVRNLVAACGHTVVLAGNNDVPFSAAVMAEPPPEFIVLEVSSYQLETVREFRPWIAAVLNITPDHLARHASMEKYAEVKARIFARQRPGDIAVINADDERTRELTPPDNVALWTFSLETRQANGLWLDRDTIRAGSTPVAGAADVHLPGRHNLQNALAALTIMRAGRFDWGSTVEALRRFQGVEHRIEYVCDIAGVRFYNDSKSTNIDSLRAALDSFEAPVVLIAGGRGKGADYRTLRAAVQAHVKAMVLIGEDAPQLAEAFSDLVHTQRAGAMDDAVACAMAQARAGDVVLLSPACASFDMYRDFAHRGRVFKEAVTRHAETRRAKRRETAQP